ncbi:MAG: C1 family peptidase [Acholeplasma sp.]|nr:C1 family peptidase [Acholeplasma sp.]
MKEISIKYLDEINKHIDSNKTQKALRRVLYNNDLESIFKKQEENINMQFLFSNEIKTLPVTNQKQSGRCWIFAGLNLLREEIAKKYNLKDFELSQNYVAFYDKLEKINYFLEAIDDFLDVDYDDRTLQHLLKTGIQDGGQWDMFVSLIQKYGVVPITAMPETKASSNTRFMNGIINVKLRKYAAEARALKNNKKQIEALKKNVLEELYTFLVTSFGMPPQNFIFEYENSEGYQVIKDLTPVDFYRNHAGVNLEDFISIIHAPTFDKPYMKTYTVSYLGNVLNGRKIKYLNLDMKELKKLTIKQLLNNEVVWFGSDVARYGDRLLGVWDTNTFDYEEMLEMSLEMSKEDQLLYSQSAMNHAMLITGVHLDNAVSKRFKIENSWGPTNGNKGYYVASDDWFDDFVYQVVINKKHLTKEQLDAWNQKPIVLKPWDPMGSLAK